MNGLIRILDGLNELAPAPDDTGLSDEARRARRLMSLPLRLEKFVFAEDEFPALAAVDVAALEELIGPHEVKTTFYDRDFNPVTRAEQPGRYGAVIEIVPQNGRVSRRFRTVFRQPQAFGWWRQYVPVSIEFPTETGISGVATRAHREEVSNYLKSLWLDSLRGEWSSAALMAGLYESTLDPVANDDVWARDRQWWVQLKRKLYGLTEIEPFIAPRPFEGNVAPALRDGTLPEAGIASGADEKLDALCREWAQNSDQGFVVCLARRGVVWFHRAYGTRGGQPVTAETPGWMASISKLLAGSLLMMLVDAGRVSLDEPIGTYLPFWREVPTATPLTLRHLMTHTAGLWGHIGDEMHDWEELVADYAPHLAIGQRYEYNGASFALAGKVIEAVTGESLPHAFRNHLLQPLGMAQTQISTMSWNTHGTARDLATFGQMLLNKGAYGNQRFFSEESFSMLLPQRLTRVLGPDTTDEYGIGSSWFKDEGLGESTFGHGAASAATLRIDPQNELVVMMSRNEAGSNFDTYHPSFLKLIGDSVLR